MARERIIAACAVVVGVLIISTATAQAALATQAETPSPPPEASATLALSTTPAGRLVTITAPPGTPGLLRPTSTLLPPPASGGRVAVDALYVRDQPAFSGNVIGIIPYNQSIFPVGRNADGTWVAVNWASARGWVYAEMVVWDPAISLLTLPILVDATGIPPTATIGETPTPFETGTPAATETLPPTLTAAPLLTPTRVAVVVPPANTPPATPPAAPRPTPTRPAPAASGPGGIDAIPASARLPLFGGLGLLVLAGVLYVWQWSAGRTEVRRYARGFVLSICPVCQEGHIHLDEVVRTTLGIQWVRRSARCDTCRSVLREIRPGTWRYSVDAFVNPEMAERFKTQPITTADLQELARNIVLKPMQKAYDEPTTESLNLKWLEIDEPLDDTSGQDSPPES